MRSAFLLTLAGILPASIVLGQNQLKAASAMTAAIALSISAWMLRYCAFRSTNGMAIAVACAEVLRSKIANLSGWVTRINSGLSDIPCDDGSGADDDIVSNVNRKNRRIASYRDAIAHFRRAPKLL